MSFNVAMLEAMQAEGLDLDACIRVLKAGEKRSDPTAAERMRNMRARRKASPVTRNVTPEPLPNDIYSNPTPEPVETSVSTSPCRFSVQDAVETWNATARACNLPIAKSADGVRAKSIRARLKAGGEDGWREALAAVERSKFCRGENDRGFRADIDFVAQPKSFNRLREGFYGSDADAPGKVVQLDPQRRADTLEATAAIYRNQGRDDEAADLERKAARMRGPVSIGALVSRVNPSVLPGRG